MTAKYAIHKDAAGKFWVTDPKDVTDLYAGPFATEQEARNAATTAQMVRNAGDRPVDPAAFALK